MKKFIVNEHNLATVECGLSPRHCPVYYKVLADKAKNGELSLAISCDNNLDVVFNVTVPMASARALKADIMNQCMDCNVQGR